MTERPMTYDHLRGKKKPNFKTVRLPLDSEIADAFEDAKAEEERLKTRLEYKPDDRNLLKEHDAAVAKLEEAKALMLENSVLFKFRSIGRKRFDDLIFEHPPTEAQIKKAKENGSGEANWNEDTFPIALIHACLVDPKMEEHEVKDLWDSEDWSGSEVLALFWAALEVNSNRRAIDLGKG